MGRHFRHQQRVIRAQCWWGGQGERPSNEAKLLNMTRQAPADGGTVLVGQLPERPNHPEDVILHTDYSCNYGFIQKYDGDPGNNGVFPSPQFEPFKDGSVADSYPSYLVAGSNQIAPFNGVQTVTSYIDETGFDFEEHQQATANPEHPFKHFPTGGPSQDIDLRNPTKICLSDKGPCPNPDNNQ